jgi:hypothetical protein
MSELSFLIENQNEVVVDESYLEKKKNDKEKESVVAPSVNRVLSSRELKINRNYIANRKKHTSPRSINFNSTSNLQTESSTESEELYKISLRLDALE